MTVRSTWLRTKDKIRNVNGGRTQIRNASLVRSPGILRTICWAQRRLPELRCITFHEEEMAMEFNHNIQMRYGVLLRADLFFPQDSVEDQLGTVLAITPYGKQNPSTSLPSHPVATSIRALAASRTPSMLLLREAILTFGHGKASLMPWSTRGFVCIPGRSRKLRLRG